MILHVIDWLTEQLDPHNPVMGELTDAADNNLAELDVRDTRYRPVINLLADRLPAHAHALVSTDQELSQHLQQLGAAARRHRRRQLAIRSGDARAATAACPRPPTSPTPTPTSTPTSPKSNTARFPTTTKAPCPTYESWGGDGEPLTHPRQHTVTVTRYRMTIPSSERQQLP